MNAKILVTIVLALAGAAFAIHSFADAKAADCFERRNGYNLIRGDMTFKLPATNTCSIRRAKHVDSISDVMHQVDADMEAGADRIAIETSPVAKDPKYPEWDVFATFSK